jgi:hypothetical protein
MRYRIIYSLYIDLGQPPGRPPGESTALVIQLDRKGMRHGGPTRGNGRSRTKSRPIDLRPGDQIQCDGQWRTIKSIVAYRDHWLTEAQADACEGDHGYIYKVAEQKCESAANEFPPEQR